MIPVIALGFALGMVALHGGRDAEAEESEPNPGVALVAKTGTSARDAIVRGGDVKKLVVKWSDGDKTEICTSDYGHDMLNTNKDALMYANLQIKQGGYEASLIQQVQQGVDSASVESVEIIEHSGRRHRVGGSSAVSSR